MDVAQLVVKQIVCNALLILARDFSVEAIRPSNVKQTIAAGAIDCGEAKTERLFLASTKLELLQPLNELHQEVPVLVNILHLPISL